MVKKITVLQRRRDGFLYWIVRIQRMNTNQVSAVKLDVVCCFPVALGGLVVVWLTLDSRGAGSTLTGELDGFLWALKILKHNFLWRGSKAVGTML
jgi:hypothetical protein